jgi:hypothetical protein
MMKVTAEEGYVYRCGPDTWNLAAPCGIDGELPDNTTSLVVGYKTSEMINDRHQSLRVAEQSHRKHDEAGKYTPLHGGSEA